MNFPPNINVVLVCGGRNYADYKKVREVLDKIHSDMKIDLIVQGGARGADKLAEKWAEVNEIDCLRIPAKWKTYGKMAGGVRNARMAIISEPNLVVAFPGGVGTQNMINVAKLTSIEVVEVE